MVGVVCNIHTSGATLQRLVSAKKPRSDLALAPFSIFVTVSGGQGSVSGSH